MNQSSFDREKWTEVFLRAALAIAFAYPAIDAYFNPGSWIGFFPGWMRGIVPDAVLLHLFGGSELVIAGWLLFAKRVFIPSVLSAIYLIGIVVFNWKFIDLLFRDVSILGISIALAIAHYRK